MYQIEKNIRDRQRWKRDKIRRLGPQIKMLVSSKVAEGVKDGLRRDTTVMIMTSHQLVHLFLNHPMISGLCLAIGLGLRVLSLRVLWLNPLSKNLATVLVKRIT